MREKDVQKLAIPQSATDVALLSKNSHESGTRLGLLLPSKGLYYELKTVSHVLSNDTWHELWLVVKINWAQFSPETFLRKYITSAVPATKRLKK